MKTIEFTAKVDDREKSGVIASRIGLRKDAYVFDPATELFSIIKKETAGMKAACVFLDEAQFLTAEQVMQLARAVDTLDVPVICYGLRTDFMGDLFEGSARLLAVADDIRELKTICKCGRKATMNLRIDAEGNAVTSGEKIEIGGNDRYVPLCRRHFYEAFNS